ncbi:MAG: hypothetical protein NT041_02400 [Candidatus Vogelbacteria bacterium]|nr:hypothetical protein [Candidatus Vogelbacteria bacterium]
MFKKITQVLDKLEDKVRGFFSEITILYAFIGGIGIVLFWRGIWDLSEEIGISSLESLVISLIILLSTGLFVSFFIGDRFIIASLKGEKKIIEKTKEEIINEEGEIRLVLKKLGELEQKLDQLAKSK